MTSLNDTLHGREEMVMPGSIPNQPLKVEILAEDEFLFRLWSDVVIPDEGGDYLKNTDGYGYALIALDELRPLIEALQRIEKMVTERQIDQNE